MEHFPQAATLGKEIVYTWSAHQPHEAPNNQQFRISVIQQFAKYLNSQEQASFIHPPCNNMTGPKYMPYIFTMDVIGRIFHSADHLGKRIKSPYYHITTPIILKTLYGCGLRISETLNLCIKNLDLESKSITVLESKFDKDRIVPMSDSLWKLYQNYVESYRSNATPNEPLFPDQITAHGFYNRFREVLRYAGISHRGRGKGPRVHDMRHPDVMNSPKKR